MASEVEIANDVLSRLGFGQVLQGDVDGTLANCTDASFEKSKVEQWFSTCRKRLLNEHPWTFARKVATLVLDDDLSETTDLWGIEWENAYEYPADCIRARRFLNDGTPGLAPGWCNEQMMWPWANHEWEFIVRVHGGNKVILTDVAEENANLEYTEDVTDPDRFTEDFRSALTWYIAHECSLPLSVSIEKADIANKMFYSEKWKAKAYDVNEENPRPEANGPHLAARRGR